MKGMYFKAVQFSSAILVLMEGIKQLDIGFSFPWFYLVAGLVMLSLVPVVPALGSKHLITGIAVFIAEALLLILISLRQFDALKTYAGLLYIIIAILLLVGAFNNFRKLSK